MAAEAAISLANVANTTLVYRGSEFNRPKKGNIDTIYALKKDNKLNIKLNTTINEKCLTGIKKRSEYSIKVFNYKELSL